MTCKDQHDELSSFQSNLEDGSMMPHEKLPWFYGHLLDVCTIPHEIMRRFTTPTIKTIHFIFFRHRVTSSKLIPETNPSSHIPADAATDSMHDRDMRQHVDVTYPDSTSERTFPSSLQPTPHWYQDLCDL
jgi:hypothetical protein